MSRRNRRKSHSFIWITAFILAVSTGIFFRFYNEDANLPEYDGTPYTAMEENIPSFTEKEKASTEYFETYSSLDDLGRCGAAFANICTESMPAEENSGGLGAVKPSGWQTVKYNDLIDGNYLYNRCHLIGYQLAGETANEKNLITGTRYLNIEGMLPFENEIADYVETTDNHVLYRVTPLFEEENLVASGVQMEAWSVEDQGEGICFNVYCFNVQPGIHIDYADGDSYALPDTETETESDEGAEQAEDSENRAGSAAGQKADAEGQSGSEGHQGSEADCDYVINANTGKFHLPDCSSVDAMAEKNKIYYKGTIEELTEEGYAPCQICLKDAE